VLKHIKEFRKQILITGIRNVKIEDAEAFLEGIRRKKPSNVEIQFFDAKFVATWQHLYFAVLNALKAFRNKENISKSIAMETLLYASAQRQIQKAMKLGIKSGASNIAVLIIAEKPEALKSALSMVLKYVNAQQDDAVLELSNEKIKIVQRTFGISDLELKTVMEKGCLEEALTDLVIERMALLVTER